MKRVKINYFGVVHELDFDSEEFKKAREMFFKRLDELAEKKDPRVTTGLIGASLNGANEGIPFPFGCQKLEICLWGKDEGGSAIAYFCGELGCLCAPCRGEDFLDEYINRAEEWHCPDRVEIEFGYDPDADYPDDYWDVEDERGW